MIDLFFNLILPAALIGVFLMIRKEANRRSESRQKKNPFIARPVLLRKAVHIHVGSTYTNLRGDIIKIVDTCTLTVSPVVDHCVYVGDDKRYYTGRGAIIALKESSEEEPHLDLIEFIFSKNSFSRQVIHSSKQTTL